MKEKVLFVAHMDSHIANFHLPYLKWFQEQGYETHVASNSLEKTKEILYCDIKHQIDFKRSPFALKNIEVYRSFKRLLKENNFTLIHAHTPMGGLIARLAARKHKNIKVIYTVHGFHFLKGGPKLSWLLFYPIEKLLSRYTDEIITINEEDYKLAKRRLSKKADISLIDGVGVNLKDYYQLDHPLKLKIRKSLNLDEKDFVLVYVAELTKGKNQVFLIDFMEKMVVTYPNLKLLLLGYGKEEENIRSLIKQKQLEKNILQLGFRTDVLELTNIADLIVSASLREGLPKAILEALAIGKPILASRVRGNKDLVEHGKNGYLYEPNDMNTFIYLFKKMLSDKALLKEFSENSLKLSKKYDLNKILNDVTTIYLKYLVSHKKEGNS